MPPSKVTEEERARIVEAIKTGQSARSIAADFERSTSTVAKIARQEGLHFDRTKTAAATKAKQADNRQRRADQATRLLDEADEFLTEIGNLRGKLHGQTLVFSFGGRDNVYNEHLLDEPDTATIKAVVGSIRDLVASTRMCHTTVLDMERIDQPQAGHGALEQLVEAIGKARASQ